MSDWKILFPKNHLPVGMHNNVTFLQSHSCFAPPWIFNLWQLGYMPYFIYPNTVLFLLIIRGIILARISKAHSLQVFSRWSSNFYFISWRLLWCIVGHHDEGNWYIAWLIKRAPFENKVYHLCAKRDKIY